MQIESASKPSIYRCLHSHVSMIQKGCRHAELEIWQLRQGLIRVIAKNEPSKVFIGEPLSSTADVCSALRNSQDVWAYLFTGSLVLSPGKQEQSKRSRLTEYSLHSRQNEVGTMRCIGPHVKCFVGLSVIPSSCTPPMISSTNSMPRM